MRRIYITFSGHAYNSTTEQLVRGAEKIVGLENVWVYDDAWLLGTEFYERNKWLWTYPEQYPKHHPLSARGFGWFCWKPFIIMDALSRLNDGDVLLYTDADTYPIADFSVLYDACKDMGGIMLFKAQGHSFANWCSRDTLICMGMEEEHWRHRPAGCARFMLFQKGPWLVQQFLMEWQAYCLNPRCQGFEPSRIKPEYPDLNQHRTEQAIMTALAHKYGIKLHREADGYGTGALADGEDAWYPVLFHQDGSTGERLLCGSAFRNVPGRR